jgi:hypothetical protein
MLKPSPSERSRVSPNPLRTFNLGAFRAQPLSRDDAPGEPLSEKIHKEKCPAASHSNVLNTEGQ